MALIPDRDTTVSRIYEEYVRRQRVAPPRSHMGASEIGNECERQIWYSFRWVIDHEFTGQMLRLFDTGKHEENRIVADLNSIGVNVLPFDLKTGRQFRMEMFGGHFGGSLDGIAIGFVEAPKAWHVTEFKTHNEKSFKDLASKGVKESKPVHWTQMQTYMGMSHESPLPGMQPIDRAFYLAVNKNNDQLYAERIHYDGGAYLQIKEKARRIVFSPKPLPKISEKADFYQCKWCKFQNVCHGKDENWEKPRKNCRTCLYSTPTPDGKWHCEKWNKILCLDEQVQGCEKHLYLPSLLPYEQIDVSDQGIIYQNKQGERITNYEGGEIYTHITIKGL